MFPVLKTQNVVTNTTLQSTELIIVVCLLYTNVIMQNKCFQIDSVIVIMYLWWHQFTIKIDWISFTWQYKGKMHKNNNINTFFDFSNENKQTRIDLMRIGFYCSRREPIASSCLYLPLLNRSTYLTTPSTMVVTELHILINLKSFPSEVAYISWTMCHQIMTANLPFCNTCEIK